jgi:hypothetical protein
VEGIEVESGQGGLQGGGEGCFVGGFEDKGAGEGDVEGEGDADGVED